MAINQLSDGGVDGTVIGQSASDKVGFFGKAPVAQQAVIASDADTTTEFTRDIAAIVAVLKAYGLIASS
jgi:hypothetical protein